MADITSGLVGWWKFDEGSGLLALDSSGNGNTGTLTNGPTWVAGKIGPGALNFAVSGDDLVNCGSGSSLDNLQDLTYAAWVNPRTFGEGAGGVIVQKGSDPNTKRLMTGDGVGNNFRGEVPLSISGVQKNSALNSISYNTWQHVAMTYNNSTKGLAIYKNGVLDSSGTGTGNPVADAADDLLIGNYSDTARAYDGWIDDVRVYNRALSSSDVMELANYPTKSFRTPLRPRIFAPGLAR